MDRQFSVAVDIGGTFTDLVALDLTSGALAVAKARSTPADLSAGILACIAQSGVAVADIAELFHGSTVVINAIIERKGAKTGLITTRGFRDVLEIGRGNRPVNYDLFYQKPEPFVSRPHRFEINERIGADGSVVRPLTVSDLDPIVDEIKKYKLEAIGICFLHSYANRAHEDAALAYLKAALPGLYICASSDIASEWREFERSSTTVLNAFVGPKVESYLSRLSELTSQAGFKGRFYIMQSSGGVMTGERAKQYPVGMVESGPVAGMIGAARIGTLLQKSLVIGFDMGGTTAKASLIVEGQAKIIQTYYVNGYEHGHPLQVPTIEVIEVGTGGGSLAWINEVGALKVGPRSAGSVPGPVCTRAGGTEPTVTDANVVLGRINAADYLGGQLPLDIGAAEGAIQEKIGKPLKLSTTDAAAGVVTIANSNMALAVRGITVQKGVDPRAATMIAFGGGGPLHAAEIAREIGIREVIIPHLPSCFSALGMLLADPRQDLVRTCVWPFPGADYAEINAAIAALSAEGRAKLALAGVEEANMVFAPALDLRYRGQQWTLTVSTEGDTVDATAAQAIRQNFDGQYDERFGHSFPKLGTELVNVRVVASRLQKKPEFPKLPARAPNAAGPATSVRRAYVQSAGLVDCLIVRRNQLLAGDQIRGPAIIEEENATTVIGPDDFLTVDEYGFLSIRINEKA